MERKNQQRRSAVNDKWFEGEDSSVFSWPQRNYACSFCRKQFSSAQALGGHMNVHRRERARLRELPSWFFERPKFNPTSSSSNPNPNFSSSSTSNFLPCPRSSTSHRSLLSPSLTTSFSSVLSYLEKKPKLVECPQHKDLTKKKRTRPVVGVGDQLKETFPQEYNCEEKLKNSETSINLDLEMGYKDRKEFLDLELRLGYFQH